MRITNQQIQSALVYAGSDTKTVPEWIDYLWVNPYTLSLALAGDYCEPFLLRAYGDNKVDIRHVLWLITRAMRRKPAQYCDPDRMNAYPCPSVRLSTRSSLGLDSNAALSISSV